MPISLHNRLRRAIAVLNGQSRHQSPIPHDIPYAIQKKTPLWVHILLFITTFCTTTLAGSDGRLTLESLTKNGLPFSVTLMLILLSHEMGHYFAARKFGLNATLPFFIPVPHVISLIGTLGAVIKIKSPLRNRRALLYVGMAGPIAGFIISLAAVIIGLFQSHVQPIPILPPGGFLLHFGDSLLFRGLTLFIHGAIAPGHDIMLAPIAWAGWIGFLVTALNLMPIGQLDGGHIMHALIGKHQRWFGWAAFFGLVALCVIWFYWIAWIFLVLFFIRIGHPLIGDDTPLSRPERATGWATMLILIATFIPIPVEPIENDSIFPIVCRECKTSLEPSGIAIVHERIIIVNDADQTIYQLVPKEDGLHALPFFTLKKRVAGTDFEGMALHHNLLYLADERLRRVLKTDLSGAVENIAHDIAAYNRRNNIQFSHDKNAGFEGIALSDDGTDFYVLNEREPCIIYRLRKSDNALITISHVMPKNKGGIAVPDASDLYFEQGYLYVISRAQNKILKIHPGTAVCENELDFSAIAVRLYVSEKGYGFAEGMTMHKGKIFLLFDSNGRTIRNSKIGEHGTLAIIQRPEHF